MAPGSNHPGLHLPRVLLRTPAPAGWLEMPAMALGQVRDVHVKAEKMDGREKWEWAIAVRAMLPWSSFVG